MPDVISQITSHPLWAEVDGKERRLILRDALAKQPQWAEVDPHEQEKITHEVWDKYAPESPVTATATAQIGKTPYKWGGEDLNKGADCSGFTCRVYEKAGKKLPRTAREQFKMGTPVQSQADLQPGDQIFFKGTQKELGPDDASHTGIYLGDGRFVHASSAKGNVVEDDLSKPYWKKKWLGAKRHVTTPGGNMPIVNGAVEEAMTAVRQKAASKAQAAQNVERAAAELGMNSQQARAKLQETNTGIPKNIPYNPISALIDAKLSYDPALRAGVDAGLRTGTPFVGDAAGRAVDALAGQEGTMQALGEMKGPRAAVARMAASALDPVSALAGGAIGGALTAAPKAVQLGIAGAIGAPAVAGGVQRVREGDVSGGATEAALGIGALLLPGLIGKRQTKAMSIKLDALQNGESLSLTNAGANQIVSVLDPKKLQESGLEIVTSDAGKGKVKVQIVKVEPVAPTEPVVAQSRIMPRKKAAPVAEPAPPVPTDAVGGIVPPAEPIVANPEPFTGTVYRADSGADAPTGARFWSVSEKEAQRYAAGYGSKVRTESLSLSNPLRADNWMDAKQKLGLPKSAPMDSIFTEAQKRGHDGIVWTQHGVGEVVQFEPTAAKTRTPRKKPAPVAEPVAEPVVTPEPVVAKPAAEPVAKLKFDPEKPSGEWTPEEKEYWDKRARERHEQEEKQIKAIIEAREAQGNPFSGLERHSDYGKIKPGDTGLTFNTLTTKNDQKITVASGPYYDWINGRPEVTFRIKHAGGKQEWHQDASQVLRMVEDFRGPASTPKQAQTKPVAAPAPAPEPTGVTAGTKLHKPDTDTYQTVLKVEDGVAHVKASTGTVVKMPVDQLNARIADGKYNVVPAKGTKPKSLDQTLKDLPKDANIGLDPRPYVEVMRAWGRENVKPTWDKFKEWARQNEFLNPGDEAVMDEKLRKHADAIFANGGFKPSTREARATTPMPVIPKGAAQDEEAISGQVPQGQAKQAADAAASPIKEGNAQAKPVQEGLTGVAKVLTGREPQKGLKISEALENGKAAIASGVDPRTVANRTLETGNPMNDTELSAVGVRVREVATASDKLLDQIGNSDPHDAIAYRRQLQDLDDEMETLLSASDLSLNKGFHRLGMAAQIALDKDHVLQSLPKRAKAATYNDPSLAPAGMDAKVEQFRLENARLKSELEKAKSDIAKTFKVEKSSVTDTPQRKAARARARTDDSAWLKTYFGKQEGTLNPSSRPMRKNQGSVSYTIPREEIEAMRRMRRLAKTTAEDLGTSHLDDILPELKKSVGNVPDEQIYRMLSEPYNKYLLESDVNRNKAAQYLKDIQRTADYRLKTPLQKGVYWANEGFNATARTLQAGADISAPFIQGKLGITKAPDVWVKSWGPMLKAIKNPEYADHSLANIQRDELFSRSKAAGLELTSNTGAISGREEMFASNLVSMVEHALNQHKNPVSKGLSQILSVYGRSEAAYQTFLNELRYGMFKKMARLKPDDPEYLKDIAMAINTATGRGSSQLAKVVGGSEAAGKLVYAPRYTISQWEGAMLRPLFKAKTKEGRWEAAKWYASTAAFYGALVGLAKLSGIAIQTDPRASDFGQVQLPNGYKMDLFGKFAKPFTLLNQMVTGKISAENNYTEPSGKNASAIGGEYAKNKLAPVPRIGWEMTFGKPERNESGKYETKSLVRNNAKDTAKEFAKLMMPIWVQGAMQDNYLTKPAMAIPAFAGVEFNRGRIADKQVPRVIGGRKR